MTEPIPGPRGLPFLGNIRDIDPSDSMKSLMLLADTYGPIFRLTVGGIEKIFISSQELLNEICDEKRFEKSVNGTALLQVRNGVEDGLFTAHTGEHNWEVAHRTLMPAFGPLSIRSMYDEMHDIASQLVVKWARFGPKDRINVTDDFTRLTLDSIALCAMDTRFNSFYHEKMHPFVDAMVGFLAESGARSLRPAFTNALFRTSQQKYFSDIEYLKKVSQEVVEERRANPSDKKDLLNAMIQGRDPKTGEGLTDASIINNMITFLIAGHETTSGMLSFLFYNLIKSPNAYQRLQQEVDEVVGKGPVTVEHLSKLPYVEACLRETLRLTPTAPAFSVKPKSSTTTNGPVIIGGKYQVAPEQVIISLLPKVHRDPSVYGEDSEEFRPERMEAEPFSKLPPNSWKPFGNGMRGCIGRPFAWQEAILTVALLFQNFDFRLVDPSYQLSIKQTLTLKPKDMFMYATLRDGIDVVQLEKTLHVNTSDASKNGPKQHGREHGSKTENTQKPMTILYGSNSGTCEALAQSLASEASERGYKARVNPLDSAVNSLPKQQPVIIITASYEGQPPDNAAHFVNWLEELKGGEKLKNVSYAVYGCGNHDWVNTFHRIPKLIDAEFERNGASRFAEIGLGDVAAGDIFEDFDAWQDERLWTKLESAAKDNVEAGLEVEIDVDSRRSTLRQDVQEAVVISNKLLTVPGISEKRNLTLQLPTGMEYKVGDYLGVLPINHRKSVHRVLKRYGLPWDTVITIKPGANTTLPTNRPISVVDLLGAYVELTQPSTRKHLTKLIATIPDDATRKEAESLTTSFETEITNRRVSVLDLLEKYPSATLPLGDFLAMLPPMRVRQYSIASSPLADPTVASLGWSVLDAPHKSSEEKRHLGVASNYLSALEAHDHVHVTVKPSHGAFHLPSDIENTPIIMACAGAGISPFRGFVEERAMQKAAGRRLAPAYLFVGCQDPAKDRLFAEDFDKWEQEGVVKMFYAYSQATEKSEGCRYVQDRLWNEKEIIGEEFKNGAKFYVCGSARVGEGVNRVAKEMYKEAALAKGLSKTDEEVETWFRSIRGERFASDLFD